VNAGYWTLQKGTDAGQHLHGVVLVAPALVAVLWPQIIIISTVIIILVFQQDIESSIRQIAAAIFTWTDQTYDKVVSVVIQPKQHVTYQQQRHRI
jgi:hypothetical protein